MKNDDIKLFTDNEGIWCQESSGSPFGIKWNEIFSISGYTMEYFDTPEIEIEFDFEYGEYFRINETWDGFDNVVHAINKRSLFLEKDWLDKVRNVGEDAEIYIIWRSS